MAIEQEDNGSAAPPSGKYLLYLALGALGVVYGDIGTSPLYAFRESFREEYGIPVTPENILGVLSLIFWALTLIISIKYLVFVLRADNQGEGGILALTALVRPERGAPPRSRRWVLIMLGLFGTALLYGDGMITPALSVLSAVEGLEVATPVFRPYIVPITIGILVALFMFQSRGTERVGKVFGPATMIWFLAIAVLGLAWVVRQPHVFVAINPLYGARFFVHNGWEGFLVLGSVFLVVTGGEALYADMGHFGRRPIRLAWFSFVFPALLLNYFGQGALLFERPQAIANPFYSMAPSWALYPLVVLATAATVIASQALITGAFSLTMQAVQLGFLPRINIRHTSSEEYGQIYVPGINWILMIACIALVIAFGSSSALASAYGVAVTTTMVITTVLLFSIERKKWHWPVAAAVVFTAFYLTVDLSFWGANLLKIPDGGWFPLAIGAVVFTLMVTWRQGRRVLAKRLSETTVPFDDFVHQLNADKVPRVPGTAVFMYSNPAGTPPALINNLKHNKVLHDNVILLSVESERVPHVPARSRIELEQLEHGFSRVVLHYGFMQDPNVARDLARCQALGLDVDPLRASYFLGREWLIPADDPDMASWRQRLFAVMSRNSRNATDFFHLPPGRVVELGTQVEL
ncbi:MAG: potassium transporter Kup [Caldilineaceae bacterium]